MKMSLSDIRCQCCGRLGNELKPYDNIEERPSIPACFKTFLVAYLALNYRPGCPYDKEVEKDLEEAAKEDPEDPVGRLIVKFGKEETKTILMIESLMSSCDRSWECRDCIPLSNDEYFKKISTRK